ncbi:MAG: LamG-like jellyroll fold domain-containing protein, partial [Desulfobacula sp.]
MDSDNQIGFQVNGIDRPGICSVSPSNGAYPSSTNIIGNKFTVDTSDVVWNLGAFVGATWNNGKQTEGTWQNINSTSSAETNWTVTTVTDVIPASGVNGNMAKIRVYNGQNYSNNFLFTLSNGLEGSFCGGSDEGVCVAGDGACSSSLGLVCNHSSCTCQKGTPTTTCQPGTTTSTPCDSVGNCSYVSSCNASGTDWECIPKSDDPNCSPNLFIASASQSLYAWGFRVTAWGGTGQSCGQDVWGVCDPRGCNSGLTCNTEGGQSWLELYCPANVCSSSGTLAGYKVDTVDYIKDLVAYYPLRYNSNDLLRLHNGTSSTFLSGHHFYPLESSAYFSGIYNSATTDKFRDYIELTPSILNTKEGTLSAWVYPNDTSVGHIIYFGKNVPNADGFGGSPEIHLTYNAGKISLGYYKSGASTTDGLNGKLVSSANNYPQNYWYHVVATYKDNDFIKIYVNGSLVVSDVLTDVTKSAMPVFDRGFIGRATYPLSSTVSRAFVGSMRDVSIYNTAMGDNEVKLLENHSQEFTLNGSLNSKGLYVVDNSTVSNPDLTLPQSSGLLAILNNDGQVVDSMRYGNSYITSALAPYSFGRKKDGLDTSSNGDFEIFKVPTSGGYNSVQQESVTSLKINEVSIGAKPCTCVAQNTCNKEGEEESCDSLNNCERKRVCHNGTWSDCQVISEACYLPVAQATQAIFSWAFMMHVSSGNDWPFVIEDCNRSLSCDSGDKLPSPTPWYLPNSVPGIDEGWSVAHAGVVNPSACENAIISARFSQQMLENSFIKNDSVKVYKKDGSSNWINVNISNLTLEDNDRQLIIDVGTLDASTTYKVILTDSIKSYVGWPLKKGNASYVPVVDSRDCAIDGNTATAYCWNFQTRSADDPDFKCKEGCPTCTPNPTKGGYYGEENINNANLDSKDNVCLMLNPWTYNWNWSTTSPAGYYREDISNGNSYGWNMASGTLTSIMDSFIDPRQTSTARGETINDAVTTTINATLVASNKSGVCVVKNDFTNPYIINESNCNASSTPSPSPRPGATDVCLNAAVMGRFNLDMFDASVVSGTSHPNLIVQECDSTSTATSSPRTSGQGCTDVTGWSFEIFPYSHSELSMNEMISHPGNTSNTPEGFLAYPPEGSKLDPNKWYRVIVKGSDSGVRSASNASDGTENAQGVLIKTNFPGDSSLPPDYYWIFKTGNGLCKIDYVDVSPFHYFMPYAGLSQQYTAIPYNCNKDNKGISTGVVLNPDSFTWNWRSLMQLTDDINETDPSGGTGISIARICPFASGNIAYCDTYNNTNTVGHRVGVFGIKEGPIVDIKARAVNTRTEGSAWNADYPNGDKFGFGQLKVGSGNNFSINSRYPGDTSCSNPDIKLYFSEESNSASLLPNVNLYKCADADCTSYLSTPISISGLYPAGLSGSNPNPKFSNLMIATTSGLTSGKYRVMVYGGSGAGNPYIGGVQSWSGDGLNNLNFKPLSNVSGEACESGIYPWNTLSGSCTQNCKLKEGSLCGTRFQECTASSIGSDYCDTNCHNLGNNNIASCGNGKVESGEDCDDGNINDGDGCSLQCLLEGSNKNKYGSLCGNGKIEKGEQCDDGNIATGDGCSDKCLFEDSYAINCSSATTTPTTTFNNVIIPKICLKTDPGCTSSCKHTGTSISVPVCGNGKIEKGEQCDDGNINSGDGCKGTESGIKGCLWEGSTSTASGGTCGNGVVENGQKNYYSWTFDVANDPAVCNPVNITLNPCPNGIWQASMDKSISSSTIIIQKGYKNLSSNPIPGSCVVTTDFSSLSFFQKIIKQVKLVVRDFFGIKLAIAENYWCEISRESYDFNKLHAIDLGNYEATTTIDGVANGSHIVAYPDPSDGRVINYIRNTDWATGTPYRMTVLYSRDNVSSIVETSAKIINTYYSPSDYDYNTSASSCSIKKVAVNAWPKGEVKNFDAFFCKGENCGLDTPTDVYDDDMSAEWNQRYRVTSTSGFMSGNQHLYRAWAYTPNNYLVRANFSDFSLTSIPYNVGTARAEFSSTTYYNGGSWITSGQLEGRTNLYIKANNSIDDSIINRASTTVGIRTMFCKNPWPSTQNPRFLDSNTNCATSGGCVNTNFETWYCRDSGVEDACVGGSNNGKACKTNTNCPGGSCQLYTADDLPSIGSYNSVSGKWSAAITGLGTSTCPNLADDFVPKVGYYDPNSTSTYLWNNKGVVYRSSSNGGWVMLSRGDLAEKGLPANFGPTVGYYNRVNSRVQLWDYDGNLYEYVSGRWLKNTTVSAGLPKGFRPVGGYYYRASAQGDDLIGLWNGSGMVETYNPNTNIWTTINSWDIGSIKGIIPATVYSAVNGSRRAQMWDTKGNLYDFDSTWTAATRPSGLPTDFKPDMGYYDGSNIILWDGQKSYLSSTGTSYMINPQFEKSCDRKVKEFLFVSASNDPVQTLLAGVATYVPNKGGVFFSNSLN